MQHKKTAVILFNLGGPSCAEDIKPFLFNFFMDKNIIGAPLPIRYVLAKWIAHKRSNGAAKIAYGHMGGASPLLANTLAQRDALENQLLQNGLNAKVFVSMRYWHPLARDVIKEIEDYKPDNLVMLPLYPQFSTTTTGSSFENFWAEVQADDGDIHARWGNELLVKKIPCYPTMAGFIKAGAAHIRHALQDAPANTRVLFSAHGLPEKIVNSGDPYQFHCEQTAKALVEELGIANLDWQLCYQSRVGPLKWIGPSTEEALHKAAQDKVGLVVYPLAFVSEHVETLVEIDIEYRHKAKELGIPFFAKAQTAGTNPLFIEGLADLVEQALQNKPREKICGNNWRRCGCG